MGADSRWAKSGPVPVHEDFKSDLTIDRGTSTLRPAVSGNSTHMHKKNGNVSAPLDLVFWIHTPVPT